MSCRSSTAARASSAGGAVFLSRLDSGRGFLPAADPLQRLSTPGCEAWEDALSALPQLAVAAGQGQLRRALCGLPPFPLAALLPGGVDPATLPLPEAATTEAPAAGGAPRAELAPWAPAAVAGRLDGQGAGEGGGAGADTPELWRAYLVLSFLSHAYLWCDGPETPATLPAALARPWAAVAHALAMPPVLTYACYNLLNWRRLEAGGAAAAAVELGNIVCLNNFLGALPDEEWFRLVHVAIEARAGRALARLEPMQLAAQQGDWDGVHDGLAAVVAALSDMRLLLARMGEKCDPYIYYHRVRLPMCGWRNSAVLPGGLRYEGVWERPLQLYGETGAQSGVVAALDAALGIEHPPGWLRSYLGTMELHMPPAHRRALAALRARPGVRAATAAGPPALRAAWDEAAEGLRAFRAQHRGFAQAYIARFAEDTTGTGGSDFMPALAAYRDTTAAAKFGGAAAAAGGLPPQQPP